MPETVQEDEGGGVETNYVLVRIRGWKYEGVKERECGICMEELALFGEFEILKR